MEGTTLLGVVGAARGPLLKAGVARPRLALHPSAAAEFWCPDRAIPPVEAAVRAASSPTGGAVARQHMPEAVVAEAVAVAEAAAAIAWGVVEAALGGLQGAVALEAFVAA